MLIANNWINLPLRLPPSQNCATLKNAKIKKDINHSSFLGKPFSSMEEVCMGEEVLSHCE